MSANQILEIEAYCAANSGSTISKFISSKY